MKSSSRFPLKCQFFLNGGHFSKWRLKLTSDFTGVLVCLSTSLVEHVVKFSALLELIHPNDPKHAYMTGLLAEGLKIAGK